MDYGDDLMLPRLWRRTAGSFAARVVLDVRLARGARSRPAETLRHSREQMPLQRCASHHWSGCEVALVPARRFARGSRPSETFSPLCLGNSVDSSKPNQTGTRTYESQSTIHSLRHPCCGIRAGRSCAERQIATDRGVPQIGRGWLADYLCALFCCVGAVG